MKYLCPMCPGVISDKPGNCPHCGMPLVGKNEGHGGGGGHEGCGAMGGQSGAEVAKDFLRRFWMVTVLLIPLIFLTLPVGEYLGIRELWGVWGFWGRKYLQFGTASVIFYFSLIFFEHAKHEIKSKKFGMMTLVALAVGSGYFFSLAATFLPALEGAEFYLEISSLIWVLLFGHYLEARSGAAAGDALKEVEKLLPKTSHLIRREGKLEGFEGFGGRDVEIEELREGDVVLVKPGEKVPADGIIVKGRANFDESLISGESKPVGKKEKDKVVAGSICLDGSLEIKLERVGENSTIGQIKALIVQAQMSKPEVQKLADKAAVILTFSALTVALLTIFIWSGFLAKPLVFSLTLAITVLVIACPHALGLAIPTVSTIATSLAVKSGLFIKDLAKLEAVKDLNWVIFDKTGTLTKGEFGVKEVRDLGDFGEREILKISASLEQNSSHFIAASIVKYAQEQKIGLVKAESFKNLAGKGVEGTVGGIVYLLGNRKLMEENGLWTKELAEVYEPLVQQGKTVILVGRRKRVRDMRGVREVGRTVGVGGVLGVLVLADQIKEQSVKAVSDLHQLEVKVAMMTGDNQAVAKAVAKELRIDTYFAEVLPEEKYQYLKKMQSEGKKVMMVGDGVNDAAALKQAAVGVAIGSGTEVAVEAGDMVLTRSNPQDIVSLFILARKVYRKMLENLLWATGYNLLAIPAAAGLFSRWGIFLRPEFAAILMSFSSVIVVVNALTLRKVKLVI